MNQFIEAHREQVIGVIEGWDRIIFRGTLRRLSYVEGLRSYLSLRGILLKEFGGFCQRITDAVATRCQTIAREAGRPYLYVASSQARKDQLVEEIIAKDQVKEGLVCVLACVEPCQSFEIHKNRLARRLELVSCPRKCRFFYLYYLHREFGLMHMRIQSWLPLEVQVYINGRSYLKKRLEKAGIAHERCGNTFTAIADLKRAQAMMDDLTLRDWVKTLHKLVRVVMGDLLRPGGLLSDLPSGYYWTIRQSEYASDVMFKDAASLRDVYPALCRHAMERLSSPDVLRFLGQKQPGKREVTGSYQRRIEGVRVKHCVGNNSVKMYDKAGSVLRVETTINDAGMFEVYRKAQGDEDSELRWRKMRKAVADIQRRGQVGRDANGRYLEALAEVHRPAPARLVLDPVSRGKTVEGKPVRALRPVSPEDAALFAAVLRGEHMVKGFTNRQVADLLDPGASSGASERRRRSAQISHRLRLLRRHGLIQKIGTKRLYRVTLEGHRVMSLALSIRAYDSVDLLAA
jgi:hypothetical protein